MSEAIALPKYDFRLGLAIRKHTVLKSRDKTAIRHDARRQLKLRQRFLAYRKNYLVVCTSRAFRDLAILG
jgi:hypothetical protein